MMVKMGEVKGRKVSEEDELSLTDFRFDSNSIVSCPVCGETFDKQGPV
jgi:hypothetical protein